jgi:hypothetical protein
MDMILGAPVMTLGGDLELALPMIPIATMTINTKINQTRRLMSYRIFDD